MKKIVDFYADWCPSCVATKPMVEQFAKDNNVELQIVNVDTELDLLKANNVKSIPTVIIFNDNEKVATLVGNQVNLVNLQKYC